MIKIKNIFNTKYVVVIIFIVLFLFIILFQKNGSDIIIDGKNLILDNNNKNIFYFDNNKILYTETAEELVESSNGEMLPVEILHYYNIDAKHDKEVYKLINSSIQNMMNVEKNVFVCVVANSEEEKILKLDFDNNKSSELYNWKHYPPISFSDVFVDNKIITFNPQLTEYGYNYDMFSFYYSNNKKEQFLQTTYNKKDNIGNIISSYCIHNDNVVIYNTEYRGTEEPIRSLNFYNYSGELIEKIDIDIEEFLDLDWYFGNNFKDSINKIYSCGKYIIFKSQHGRLLFFDIEQKKFVNTELQQMLNEPLKYFSTVQNKNAVFWDKESKNIIVFNGDNGKFYETKFVFSEEFNDFKIKYIQLDSNKNLLISGNINESQEYKYFLVNLD